LPFNLFNYKKLIKLPIRYEKSIGYLETPYFTKFLNKAVPSDWCRGTGRKDKRNGMCQ
jgi:hypothetical protein